MQTIKCKQCGNEIEIDRALTEQIESQVLSVERKKHQAEIEKLKSTAKATATNEMNRELEIAKREIKAELESKQQNTIAEQKRQFELLKINAKESEKYNKELNTQLLELTKTLQEAKRASQKAELETQKKIASSEDEIRKQAINDAEEKYMLQIAEKDKQLNDTKKALEEAQRKSRQGSQQTQGEAFELDLESRIREQFEFDKITKIKKGQRGADFKHEVIDNEGNICGILLWEAKSGKWQSNWISKFKQDIRNAAANIGVIVSKEIPEEYGEMKCLESNIWVAKPHIATSLASALRSTILQVDTANKMNASKDATMEIVYQYLVSPEFKNRVESIVESYNTLLEEMEREKRASISRWSRQEKAIRVVIDSTIGMHGSLQGLTKRALPNIDSFEPDNNDED